MYVWIGPTANRITQARAADTANRIRVKERGGNATVVFVNERYARERARGLPLSSGALIQRAVSDEPKNGAYLDSLGWYYYKLADYPKAIGNLLKAIAALPAADPVVFEHLGDAYSASGETAKALEAWEKARGLDPNNTVISGKIRGAQRKPEP